MTAAQPRLQISHQAAREHEETASMSTEPSFAAIFLDIKVLGPSLFHSTNPQAVQSLPWKAVLNINFKPLQQ